MSTAPRLEPITGGWLLARDLRDAPRLAVVRLAQHHIAAHHSWGCSAGLEVRMLDGELLVSPGLAIDPCGRTAVLDRPFQQRLATGQPIGVVLRVCGDGPAAAVRTRPHGRTQDLDIPLATVDSAGLVRHGDGDRQWLRRPGSAQRLGGLIPRGAPVTGTASAWTAHVDLTPYHLNDTPAVVASAAGPPADAAITATTLLIGDLSADGFDVLVRHHRPAQAPAAVVPTATAPHAIAWLGLLPAARPLPENPEETP